MNRPTVILSWKTRARAAAIATRKQLLARLWGYGVGVTITWFWIISGICFAVAFGLCNANAATQQQVPGQLQPTAQLQGSMPLGARILLGIGSALFVGPISAFIYERMQRLAMQENTKLSIESAFRQQFDMHDRLNCSGIRTAYRIIPSDIISEEIEALASTTTDSPREICLLNTWMPDSARMRGSLKLAKENGITIKLLFLNPFSSVANQRNQDLGYRQDDQVASNIIRMWDELAADLDIKRPPRSTQDSKDSKDSNATVGQVNNAGTTNCVSLKFYDGIASIPVCLVGDKCFTGVFWYGKQGVEGSCIESTSGFFTKDVSEHFNRIWDTAQEVDEFPWQEDFPRKFSTPNFTQLFYSSCNKKGEAIWRRLRLDVRWLLQSKKNKKLFMCQDQPIENIVYAISGMRARNSLRIEIEGCGSTRDLGTALFSIMSDSAEHQDVLVGIQSHIDWGGKRAINPVVLLTTPGLDAHLPNAPKEAPENDDDAELVEDQNVVRKLETLCGRYGVFSRTLQNVVDSQFEINSATDSNPSGRGSE